MQEPFDWVAFGAFIVAVIAFLVSCAAAFFTKVQADAAIGNVAPDFEMTGHRLKTVGMARAIDIDVWNHNRQTIHVRSFKFDAPDGIDIMHQPSPGAAFAKPARKTTLKYEMAVKNIDRNSGRPVRFHFARHVNKRSG